MITFQEATALHALIAEYTLAEYEQGHYTAMAYCANAHSSVVAMAKEKLLSSPANHLHDRLVAELGRLTDWSKV